jgi:hypothetical protein
MTRTQIWSSGGGVQSTAIAALIVQGRLPKPDLAVIADTERELSTTWAYMEATTLPALASVGVTLHRVKKSTYATVDLYGGKNKDSLLIPAFTTQESEIGKMPGFCSNEWKLRVVQRWARHEHGVKAATLWMGISTDEQKRASIPTGKWQKRYPLIELNLSREDCFSVVREMGWPEPVRSSCWMCPNHREDEWLWQQKAAPADHRKAVYFEREIRRRDPHVWLHPSAMPLDHVEFNEQEDVMFGKNCQSGLCFV